MKHICALFCFLAAFPTAHAQGTLYFTAQVTNELYSRTASFNLTSNRFHYSVGTVGLDQVDIRGPGTPGSPAPVLFELSAIVCDPPLGGVLGDCGFNGNLNFSEDQISELLAGELYIDSYSTTLYNQPPMRGQILPVPEPYRSCVDFQRCCFVCGLAHSQKPIK
jgi:hypothetical protein